MSQREEKSRFHIFASTKSLFILCLFSAIFLNFATADEVALPLSGSAITSKTVVVNDPVEDLKKINRIQQLLNRYQSVYRFLDASESTLIIPSDPLLNRDSNSANANPRIDAANSTDQLLSEANESSKDAGINPIQSGQAASAFSSPKAIVVINSSGEAFIRVQQPQQDFLSRDNHIDTLQKLRLYPNLFKAIELGAPTLLTPASKSIALSVPAPNDTYFANQWGLNFFDILNAWEFNRGENMVVAVIDDSFDYTHPDLAANIWINTGEIPGNGIDDDGNGYIDDYRGWDMRNNDNYAYSTSSSAGHGTHVAGIIAGVDANGIGISGVAPNSQIMAIQGFNYNDFNTDPAVVSAITESVYYAVNNGARIINMSLGVSPLAYSAQTLQAFEDAIIYAKNQGVIVVVAAGNDYDVINKYPALFNDVLTIGALTYYGGNSYGSASYSNTGPALDFMAPGSSILSLRAASGWLSAYQGDADYTLASGTSMATPHVAGAVALLLAQDPTMTFDDIYRRLAYSATDFWTEGRDDETGYGAINLVKALSEDYYANGSLKTFYVPASDPSGIAKLHFDATGWLTKITYHTGIIHEFYNDSFYSPGEGRLSKIIQVNGTYTLFQGYYKNTDHAFTQKDFDSNDNLLLTRYYDIDGNHIAGAVVAFYPSGNLQSIYNPATKIQTVYIDEDFHENKVGRAEKIIFEEQTELRFTYPSPTASNPDTQSLYIADTLYRADTYNTSAQLLSRIYQDGDSLTYYSSGRLHTAVVDSTLQAGEKLTYEYLDENYYTDGVGRLQKISLEDGTYYLFAEYWNNTDTRKTVQYFDATDTLLETFSYDASGVLQGAQGETTLITHGKSVTQVLIGNKYAAWVAAWGFNPAQSYVYLRDLVNGTHKNVDTRFSNQSTYTPLSINETGSALTQETYPDGTVYLKLYNRTGPTILTSGLQDIKNAVLNTQGIVVWSKGNRIYRHDSGASGVIASETGDILALDLSDDGDIAWVGQSDSTQALRVYNRSTRQTKTVAEAPALNIQKIFVAKNAQTYWSTHDDAADKLFYFNGTTTQEITPAGTQGQFELLTKTTNGQAVWKSRTTLSPGVFADELFMTHEAQVTKLTDQFSAFTKPDINTSGHVAWIQDGSPAAVYARISGVSTKIADLSGAGTQVFITESNAVVWQDQNQVFAFTGGSVRTLDTGFVQQLFGVNDDLTLFFEDASSNLIEAKISLTSDYDAPPQTCKEGSTCTYYANGRLKRTTAENGSYAEYRNELFYGINIGRKTLESDGSDIEIRFTQYWGDLDVSGNDDSDKIKVKDTYQSGALIQRETFHQDQTPDTTETYFTGSGRIASSHDASTGIKFDYIDEDFNSTGQGRLSKKTESDGSYITFSDYYSGTTQARWERDYTNAGELIREREYDVNGNQIINYNSLLTLFESQADSTTGMPQSHLGESSSLVISHAYDIALFVLANGNTSDQIIQHLSGNSGFVLNTGYSPPGGIYEALSTTGAWQTGFNRWNVHGGPNAWIGLAALYQDGKNPSPISLQLAKRSADFLNSLQDISDGGLRMGPVGQFHPDGNSFFWNTKSVENNMSALALYDALIASGETGYDDAADGVWQFIKSAYNSTEHAFSRGGKYNGSEWVLDGIEYFATDTVSWLPLQRVLADSHFGSTTYDRLIEVEKMIQKAESLTGVYDSNSQLIGFSFSPASKTQDVISIEWSAQFANFYDKVAHAYKDLGNTFKYEFYKDKKQNLLSSLESFYVLTSSGDTGASYAVYPDGSGAYGIDTGHDFYTPSCAGDCTDVRSLSAVYLQFARNQSDPLVSGNPLIDSVDYTATNDVYSFYDSGNLKTYLEFSTGVLFEYIDEDLNASGRGKLNKQTNPDGSYSLFQYWSDSSTVQFRADYDNTDQLQYTDEFDVDGVTLLRRIYSNGDVASYSPTGWLTKITYHTGIIHEFYNDSFYSPGEGRLSKIIQVNGTYTLFQGYYKNTDHAFTQKDFDSNDNLLLTRYYDIDGNHIAGAVVAFYPSGNLQSIYNPATKIQTVYIDEDFHENKVGRAEKIIFEEQTELRFTYPSPTASNPDTQSLYIADTLYRADTYNTSAQLLSRIYQDGDSLTYYSSGRLHTAVVDSTLQAGEKLTYEYLDENYYTDGVGRLQKISLEDGTYYLFAEYWNNTDTRKTVQYFDATDTLLETFSYDASGVLQGAQGETTLITHGKSVTQVLIGNKYAAWVAAWGFNPAQSYVYLRDLVNGTHKNVDTRFSNQSTYTPLSINETGSALTQETYPDGTVYLKLYNRTGPTILTSGLQDIKNAVLNTQGIVVWSKGNRIYRHDSGASGVIASETGDILALDLSDDGDIAWVGQSDSTQALRVYNRSTRQTKTVAEAPALNIQKIFVAKNAQTYWSTHDDAADKLFYFNGTTTQEITPAGTQGQFELLTKTTNGQAVWKSRTTLSPGVFADELFMTHEAQVTKLTDQFSAFTKPDINTSGHVAWIQDGSPAAVYARISGVSTKIADLSGAGTQVFITESNAVVWQDQNQVFAFTGGSVRTLDTGFVQQLFGVNDDLTLFFEDASSNLIEAKISLTSDYDAPPQTCKEGSTCTYYANGRLKRTTAENGSYAEYRNELFYGINIGRKTLESDGSDIEIRFTQYWGDLDVSGNDDSDKIKVKDTYQSGALIQRETFHQDQTPDTTETYFTGSGRIASSHDASTGIKFDYIDEDFNSTGQGRLSKKTESDGSYFRINEYWGDETPEDKSDDTSTPHFISYYDSDGQLIEIKEYDRDGSELPARLGTGLAYSFNSEGNFSEAMYGAKNYDEMMELKAFELNNYYQPVDTSEILKSQTHSKNGFFQNIT